ncbi:phosphatase PAP2 family protein [Acinetobacter guillouiae]|uniref:phosphatase PAP2 family protein n=1 Tax=Acinetobacter guillouiae TaxID=106649 RepID=UPI0021D31341|nr:phosphatase PAP2 family protein [Acinetobacter guillouiae]MCU4492498.1 phosphatase PAP2 family protein [Acinetobacter guillouiae]
MKKTISAAYLIILFILISLAAVGMIRSAQYQSLALFSIVSVLWLVSVYLHFKKLNWPWYGLLLFLLSWGVFPLMTLISKFVLPWSADALLHNIDQHIFFGKILVDYFHYESYPVLADIISSCYFFFYFLVLGSVILYTVKRQSIAGQVFFNSIILLYSIGFVGYILFPASGPAFTVAPQIGGGGSITQMVTKSVNQGVTGMDVFPSLHTAISIFIVGYLHQTGFKKISLILSPIILGTIFATILLRYHYGIDVIFGIILAIIVLKLSQKWLNETVYTV